MDTIDELLSFLEEEDVRFIRLTFYDMYGVQKKYVIFKARSKNDERIAMAF